MNTRYEYHRENQGSLSPCPCQCHFRNINVEINNKPQMNTNISTQNPNSEYISSNFGNKSPLLIRKEILNCINSTNWNNGSICRKFRLKERAQSIKDKINSKYFLKNINKPEKNWNDSLNNISTYTCRFSKSPVIYSMSSLKKNINNVNHENKYLKDLLSQVPRHEKDRYGSTILPDRFKLSFTNGNFRKKVNYDFNKKYLGYSSAVMPPNDLDNVTIKSTIYT